MEGYRPSKPEENLDVSRIAVTPGFFAALGIPVRAGREFSERDGAAPKVVVVNEAFAKRYCRGRNPLGLHLMFGADSHPVLDREIVGVAGDSRPNSREPAREALYYPFTQWEEPDRLMFYVRSAGDAGGLGPSIRAAARSADVNVPLYDMHPITLRIEDSIYVERLLAMLSVAFGALATLLAALGIYGIVAFTVARRTAEIGLRMALGAQPGDMLRMVVLEAARLALAGIAVGSAAALALTKPACAIATVRRASRRPRHSHVRSGAVGLGGAGRSAGAGAARRAYRSVVGAEVRVGKPPATSH